jgi:hypothetical protein
MVTKKESEEKKKKAFKVISLLSVVVMWAIYFGAGFEDKTKKTLLVLFILLTIAVGIFNFGKKIFANIGKKPEEEVPKPMEEGELKQIIEKEIEKRQNNIMKRNPIERRSKTVNGNTIYALKLQLDLDEEKVIVIINANYKEKLPTIMDAYDSSGKEISSNPFEEPDREIEEEGIDKFGKPTRKVERIIQKKKEKKEEDKELM